MKYVRLSPEICVHLNKILQLVFICLFEFALYLLSRLDFPVILRLAEM